ncbi:hypothetical protein EKO04_001516 [Ascochyta lentis]|uniref:Inhibitor of apoptosis repeat-containing protein n=1 Tax=Ascochyta lentis TaxID=205686 RepID=A0A8H7JAK3_9PLEO|nr:hypothetical protein EKO04_001516 [Ascochyta lentis]
MAASLACLQARIDTFSAPASSKSRRTSSKSKKAPAKSKHVWPLASPSAHDLAFAGFVWKPTTASPDNVQCFSCHCQLDGWEANDVPAYEHLTHSPSCGFAVVTCIRLRTGDPGRSEEDPICDAMMQARRDTFGDAWPLDSNAGFPSIEQLVEAGWYYDPTLDTPDGATCAYCSLSLDAWDAGDDPMEEHRRRAPDCLFFALKDLYHPAPRPATKKGKRASTRTSTASTASKTRGKKRASEQIDDSLASVSEKPTRGKKRASTLIDNTIDDVVEKPTRSRKRISEQVDDTIDHVKSKTTRGKKRASEQFDTTTQEMTEKPAPVLKAKKTASKAKSASTRTSTASTATKSRSKKRTSDQIDDIEVTEISPKRMRYSSVSSLPDSLLAGTPKRMPNELAEPEPMDVKSVEAEGMDLEADISSLPASLLVGTPKKTPTRMMTPEGVQQTETWEPVDMEGFFGNPEELQGFMNDVVIDAGLDAVVAAGAKPEALQATVLDGLTKSEKEMSVEQWVLYNAQRGEEKLRQACEQQILAFEAQAMRARAAIESLPTY